MILPILETAHLTDPTSSQHSVSRLRGQIALQCLFMSNLALSHRYRRGLLRRVRGDLEYFAYI